MMRYDWLVPAFTGTFMFYLAILEPQLFVRLLIVFSGIGMFFIAFLLLKEQKRLDKIKQELEEECLL